MTVLVSDSFNRANENPLASPWVQPAGTAYVNLKLASNTVTTATPGSDAGMYHGGMSAIQDQYCKVTIGALHTGAFDASACVRIAASGGFNAYAANYNDGTNLNVYKITADSFALLSGSAVVLNVGDIIEIRATGGAPTTLSLWVNGAQLGSNIVDSTSPFTTGRAGVHVFDSAVTVDAFEAGDFSVPVGPTITQQPQNQTVNAGAQATFTVAGIANSGSLSYQWQDDSTGVFASVTEGSGAAGASYTTPAATQKQQGRIYRCIVSDSAGSSSSSGASLGVLGFALYLWDTTQPSGSDVWLRDPSQGLPVFDPAYMQAMAWPWPVIEFSRPLVVAAGMTPPDHVPN